MNNIAFFIINSIISYTTLQRNKCPKYCNWNLFMRCFVLFCPLQIVNYKILKHSLLKVKVKVLSPEGTQKEFDDGSEIQFWLYVWFWHFFQCLCYVSKQNICLSHWVTATNKVFDWCMHWVTARMIFFFFLQFVFSLFVNCSKKIKKCQDCQTKSNLKKSCQKFKPDFCFFIKYLSSTQFFTNVRAVKERNYSVQKKFSTRPKKIKIRPKGSKKSSPLVKKNK